MAHSDDYIYPLDVPCIEKQGLKYKENAAPGNDRWLTLEPEDPERVAKGDIGWRTLPEPEPLSPSEDGTPFKNLRGDL